MVKRIQCRVVHSVSLTSRSSCADPAEPSAGDPNIAKILSLIYNIKSKIYNRNADPNIERILKSIYNIQSKIYNRNVPPGLIVDCLA